MADDLYVVLGVEKSADRSSIKKAYRKLARICTPTRTRGQAAETRFKAVNHAYECSRTPIAESSTTSSARGLARRLQRGASARVQAVVDARRGGRVRTQGGGVSIEDLFSGQSRRTAASATSSAKCSVARAGVAVRFQVRSARLDRRLRTAAALAAPAGSGPDGAGSSRCGAPSVRARTAETKSTVISPRRPDPGSGPRRPRGATEHFAEDVRRSRRPARLSAEEVSMLRLRLRAHAPGRPPCVDHCLYARACSALKPSRKPSSPNSS